jgi:hypothetical protein
MNPFEFDDDSNPSTLSPHFPRLQEDAHPAPSSNPFLRPPDPEPAPVQRQPSGHRGGFVDPTGGFHSFTDLNVRMYKQLARDGTYRPSTEKSFPPILHWWS